jgi:hypothetical protein
MGEGKNEIQFLIYDDAVQSEVIVRDETIWATQKMIAGLFGVGVPAISKQLGAIISIGYRVNSQKMTKFRILATDVLKEYIQKEFKINVERMKQGETAFGKDHFRELLETGRSIRASESRIWQQITDMFSEISYDYDKNSDITKRFYATVQNKFHYAITGRTATEIIYDRADSDK